MKNKELVNIKYALRYAILKPNTEIANTISS